MNLQKTSFAKFYHQETKYSPDTISQNSHQLDWNKQPIPFKEYENSPQIDLSSYVPLSANPFSDAPLKRSSQWTEEEKPLAELSRILYFANGITAIVPYPPNPLLMRASPSAGGLYPNEIYVVCRNYSFGSGVYNYQVKTHSLCLIKEGEDCFDELIENCFNHPSLQNSDLALIVTGVFERSAWRYSDRAYRRILLDAGHILGNIALIAHLFERKAYLLGGFFDDGINSLLKLNSYSDEQSLFVLGLPKLENSTSISLVQNPTSFPSNINQNPLNIPAGKRLRALHDFSKISQMPNLRLMQNTLKEYLEENQDSKIEAFLTSEDLKCPDPIVWERCSLMNTILQRRSTRKYDPDQSLKKEKLAQVLQFAYNPQCYKDKGFDANPVYLAPELIKTYLIVNNVNGLEAGCYLYQPEQEALKQIRFKKLKEEAHYLCLGQDLGRDAAVLLFHVCDLDKAVKLYGERAYRYIHADAGQIGQRLNLAAIKTGIGVSGIGGFFDDMGLEALGISENNIIVYVTTLGSLAEDL